MASQIKISPGLIKVFDTVHSSNFRTLQSIVETEVNQMEFLTLSIERIGSLNLSSVVKLKYSYKTTARNNKDLFLIVQNDEVVYQLMNRVKTSYISSHDQY